MSRLKSGHAGAAVSFIERRVGPILHARAYVRSSALVDFRSSTQPGAGVVGRPESGRGARFLRKANRLVQRHPWWHFLDSEIISQLDSVYCKPPLTDRLAVEERRTQPLRTASQ